MATTITTLQQLADYINDYADRNPELAWDNKTVDETIERNGWNAADDLDTYTVCDDGHRKLILNDRADAEVIDIAPYDAIVVDGHSVDFASLRDAARKDYGRKVRAAREAMGLSTAELASRAGLGRTHINRVEAGRYNLTLDTMTRIGAVLGI